LEALPSFLVDTLCGTTGYALSALAALETGVDENTEIFGLVHD